MLVTKLDLESQSVLRETDLRAFEAARVARGTKTQGRRAHVTRTTQALAQVAPETKNGTCKLLLDNLKQIAGLAPSDHVPRMT